MDELPAELLEAADGLFLKSVPLELGTPQKSDGKASTDDRFQCLENAHHIILVLNMLGGVSLALILHHMRNPSFSFLASRSLRSLPLTSHVHGSIPPFSCIGKPPLRSLPAKATVGEALVAVSAETRAAPPSRAVEIAGKICMVDVLCFLCSEGNISNPAAALKNPVSALLAKGEGLVKRVEASSSILEALDVILDTNSQTLIVPIRSAFPKKKNRSQEFCWLTQEDLIRFFLNNIFLFSLAPRPLVTVLDLSPLLRPRPSPPLPALSALA
ncbi:CBS domain-containing protein CBSX5-like [Asparagus officinalis]|uniref:CBS domain-containing protein CBSX5-like n=1 Tax=Asparagus officinalis TaxID=4686 RepID=UPI00098E1D03|nr:CBS domain-containing protein CBSX5-like [Asparagus officinalis]